MLHTLLVFLVFLSVVFWIVMKSLFCKQFSILVKLRILFGRFRCCFYNIVELPTYDVVKSVLVQFLCFWCMKEATLAFIYLLYIWKAEVAFMWLMCGSWLNIIARDCYETVMIIFICCIHYTSLLWKLLLFGSCLNFKVSIKYHKVPVIIFLFLVICEKSIVCIVISDGCIIEGLSKFC